VGENQGPTGRVHKDLLAHVLKRVFPHHSSEKISAFMQYADRVRRKRGGEREEEWH